MQRVGRAALALGCCWLAGAHAQERPPEPAPDLDFLEYLGAWAGDDDEWLAIQEWDKDNADDAKRGKQQRESEPRESDEDDDDESE
jgi:hypothetical protein